MAALAPLAGIVVAALLLVAGRGLDEAAEGRLGPGFWPRVVLVGLGLACLAHAVTAWRRRGAGVRAAAEPLAPAALAGGIALIVLYVLVTPWLGWALATALFVAAFMRLAGGRRWAALGATGAVGTVALLYLFVRVVYLPLPKGDGPFEAVTIALYRLLGIF
ncbi:MAG TPA: tripartite tricarboxylate transporter TctB family protein [Methylomirabilota bacterium]|nr:tripartite tricarboxylate transporter TctB family protein [Methylomirabilota bacterium]